MKMGWTKILSRLKFSLNSVFDRLMLIICLKRFIIILFMKFLLFVCDLSKWNTFMMIDLIYWDL